MDSTQKNNPDNIIETGRLTLRPLKMSDLENMIATIMSDPDVMHWLPYSHATKTPEGQRAVAQGYLDDFIKPWRSEGYGIWAICLRKGNTGNRGGFIGYCGFLPGQLDGEGPELAYALGQSYWGKGFVTEAAKACLEWLFSRTDIERAHAVTDHDNYGSQQVMKKIGMRHTKGVDLYDSVAKGNGLLPFFTISR
ncbi:MAG: GNAT family N-acetyltransferase [Desulfobacterales bacterium]|nr:GNAT family N-acetyltransferase [Desulfobacterales bacterium]